ncbi:MAG: ABC transporter ATP-binding protein [Erysipelotrichaceae bacterium]|nr:ABC transporter ATP-binding protein [Erysipelotrichaceae bacterium]
MTNKPVIKLIDIKKSYFEGKSNELEILHGINLEVYEGEFVAIVGESGSGKSTLMNIIGALDKPSSGEYYLDDIVILKANDKQLSTIRNKHVGFVFQTFNLIGRMNAYKNVELPLIYAGVDSQKRKEIVNEKLKKVEMLDRCKHQPNELSGGQKQRIAIARAIVNDPSIILADEPTGSLDSKTSRTVMDLFHKLHKEEKCTIVLITHNLNLAEECERVITLSDGMITSTRKGTRYHEFN